MYKKVRFESDTLKRIDGDYSKKGSDVRIAEIDPTEWEIAFKYEKGLTVKQIAEKYDADMAVNFPFMYEGETVIGKSVVEDKVLTEDWEVTKPRVGLGVKDGKPYVGEYVVGSTSYSKGNPLLVMQNEVVVDKQVIVEQTNEGIKNGKNTRIAAGIKDGNLVFLVVDGWTKKDGYKWDQGMTLKELAAAMKQYGCQIVANGDGGGSVTFYAIGEGVVNALRYGEERVLNHAWIFKKKKDPNNPFRDYRITSPYGWRKSPINGAKEFHTGIDLAKSHKSPIFTFAPGEVIFAGFGESGSGFGGYGNVVAVKDNKGHLHCYCHLDSVSVKKGEQLNQGDEVGKQGATGQVTGSHLHYEVRKTDAPSYGWIQDAEKRCFEPTEYLKNYYKKSVVTGEEIQQLKKEILRLNVKIVDLENQLQRANAEKVVAQREKDELKNELKKYEQLQKLLKEFIK